MYCDGGNVVKDVVCVSMSFCDKRASCCHSSRSFKKSGCRNCMVIVAIIPNITHTDITDYFNVASCCAENKNKTNVREAVTIVESL